MEVCRQVVLTMDVSLNLITILCFFLPLLIPFFVVVCCFCKYSLTNFNRTLAAVDLSSMTSKTSCVAWSTGRRRSRITLKKELVFSRLKDYVTRFLKSVSLSAPRDHLKFMQLDLLFIMVKTIFAGFQLNTDVLAVLILRYMRKDGTLRFGDFVSAILHLSDAFGK